MTAEHVRSIRRRRVIQTVAIGTVAGLGATGAIAQENDDETTTDVNEIELGGRVSAWVGVSPEEIEDERNPTLELVEGEEYLVTWENLDGDPHNFVVVDEDDERFVETEIVSGSGTTQEVEFTAEEGMVEYFCGPHRTSMIGEVEIVDDADDEEAAETHMLTVTVEDEDEPVEGATVTVNHADVDEEVEADEPDEFEEMFPDPEGDQDDDGDEFDDENDEDDLDDEGPDAEDEDDDEDPDAEEVAEDEDPHEEAELEAVEETDEDGVVEFELEDGEYLVDAEHEDEEAQAEVTIDGGDEEVTLTLDADPDDDEETHTLTVTVEDEDEPVEGATVSLNALDIENDDLDAQEVAEGEDPHEAAEIEEIEETDEDGVVEFELEDGEYLVDAEHEDRAGFEGVTLDGEDEEVTITVEEGVDIRRPEEEVDDDDDGTEVETEH